jgi:TM2 domain-containing membrane protein YozV
LRRTASLGTFDGETWPDTGFQEATVAGQGTAGNVIAALASFFIPGLGQLLQGRLIKAALMFVMAAVLWIFLLGWVIHLWSILDAALWKPSAS